jgi:hypothetical protein
MITKTDPFYCYDNLSSKTKKLFKTNILEIFFEDETKDRTLYFFEIIQFLIKKEHKKDSYELINKMLSEFKNSSENLQKFTFKILQNLRFSFANESFILKLENLKEVYEESLSEGTSIEMKKDAISGFFDILLLMSSETYKNYLSIMDNILGVITQYLHKKMYLETIELIGVIIGSIKEKPLFYKSTKLIDYFLKLLVSHKKINPVVEQCHLVFIEYFTYFKSDASEFFDTYFEISKNMMLNYELNESEWNKEVISSNKIVIVRY